MHDIFTSQTVSDSFLNISNPKIDAKLFQIYQTFTNMWQFLTLEQLG